MECLAVNFFGFGNSGLKGGYRRAQESSSISGLINASKSQKIETEEEGFGDVNYLLKCLANRALFQRLAPVFPATRQEPTPIFTRLIRGTPCCILNKYHLGSRELESCGPGRENEVGGRPMSCSREDEFGRITLAR